MAQRFCSAHPPASRTALLAALVLLSLLRGCGGYQQQPPTLGREEVADAELALWETARGPLALCRSELASLRWDVQPVDVLGRLCCTSLTLTGCFTYAPGPPRVPVVTVAAGTPRTDEQLRRIRRHELTHWLLQCSGVDDTGDPEHTRVEWVGLL